MSFTCCGVEYTKSKPDTYWCIETDLINTLTISEDKIEQVKNYVKEQMLKLDKKYQPRDFILKEINDTKIKKIIIESLTCKKNGCFKVHITRYNTKNKKFGKEEELKGYEASFLLDAVMRFGVAKRLEQKCPVKSIPNAVKIPIIFPVAISPTIQRMKYYMGVACWADKFKEGYFYKGNKITPDKWVPDTLESELKKTFDKSLIRDKKIVVN